MIDLVHHPIYAQGMKVSVQYAEGHFADIASAADRGEDVEIERAGKPRLRLISDKTLAVAPVGKKRLLGAAKGEIWLAEDWDSAETNKEIEDLFHCSSLFPEAPTE